MRRTALALWLLFVAVNIGSFCFMLLMCAAVNRKLPPHEQISIFGRSSTRAKRVRLLYSLFYPEGRLYRTGLYLNIASGVIAVIAIVLFVMSF